MIKLIQILTWLLVINSALFNAQSFSSPVTIPANGSVTTNGVTIITTKTGDAFNPSFFAIPKTPCLPIATSPELTTVSGQLVVGSSSSTPSASTAWSITLNFSAPVNNLVFSITGVDYYENFIFNSNGGAVSITHTSCDVNVSSNQIITNGVIGGSVNYQTGGFFQITSPSSYTQLTINGNGGYAGSTIVLSGASVQAVCQAGNSKPIVHDITNTCPSNTVDLNTAHTSIAPAGTSLVWFTNNSHTGTALSGTQVTQATAGTYYAFYYDSVANCYSPASSAVIATINPCFVCSPDPYAAQQTWWLADGFRTPINPLIIDFKTGTPVLSTPSTGYGNGYLSYVNLNGLGYEGNTTVTHPVTKKFLFATDGNTLFRGSDGVAATGTSVGGGKSAGEAAAVIPDPNGILGQSFLILGNTSWNSPGGLNMSKYDLVTNTLTNLTALLPNGTIYEGLEVIPHTNGNDYWILVNTTDQKVKSYLYSKASGFNSTPVSSTDVTNLTGVNSSYIAVSSFISWDPRTSNKVLIARHNKVGLANFDPSTGTLGTWDVKVTYSTGSPDKDSSVGYSLALSPNGRYNYYAVDYSKLMYYDLQTSSSSQLATVTG